MSDKWLFGADNESYLILSDISQNINCALTKVFEFVLGYSMSVTGVKHLTEARLHWNNVSLANSTNWNYVPQINSTWYDIGLCGSGKMWNFTGDRGHSLARVLGFISLSSSLRAFLVVAWFHRSHGKSSSFETLHTKAKPRNTRINHTFTEQVLNFANKGKWTF